jgi:2,3-bisphosphoglycerate-dependent phosphoglycerate mutase
VTTLLLARHGETDWNDARRWQGHADQPLNDTGRAQAAGLAASLAGRMVAAIHSSDLARARETAEIVGERLGLPVVVDPGLREVDVGNWSGVVHDEIPKLYPAGFARWQDGGQGWEGGESYDAMGARAVAALLRIAEAHEGETVLVVAHGGTIRACRAAAEGLSYRELREAGLPPTANCSVHELRVEGGRLTTSIG